MAKDFITADTGFPNFVGTESMEEKVDRLYNYTFMLLESLRYVLRNLGEENFNESALIEFRKEYTGEFGKVLAEFRNEVGENYATLEAFTAYQGEQSQALSGFKAYVDDRDGATAKMFSEWQAEFTGKDGAFGKLESSVASIETKADDNEASINALATWKGEFLGENGALKQLESSVADIGLKADNNSAAIEGLTEFKNKQTEAFTSFKEEVTNGYALKSEVTEFTSTVTQKITDAETAAKEYADEKKTEAIADTKSFADAASQAAKNAASAAETAANAKLEEHKQSWLETAQEKAQELANAAKTDAEDYADGKYTLIENSFTDVIKKSDAQGAYINLMAGTVIGSVDENGNLYDEEGNPIAPGDIKVNAASVILDAAKDGATGIKLKADLINFGENASVDAKGNLRVTRLYGNQFGEELDNYYAKVGSALGDFGVYTPNEKSADANPSVSNDCVWGYYQRNGNEAINFFTYGYNYFGVHVGEPTDENYQVAFPKGTWDFSSCTVKNLGVYFS